MTDDELNAFLKGLSRSCSDGKPSPMLTIFNAALTGALAHPNSSAYPDNYAREMVRLAAQICREAVPHD